MNSRASRIFVKAVGILLSLFGLIATAPFTTRAQSNESPERKNYAEEIRKTYNFPFGKDNLSLPGNAAVEGNDFLQPGAFPDAEYCGHCHQEAYQPVASGVCTPTPSARRSTAPASTFCSAPRASNLRATATAATTRSPCSRARSTTDSHRRSLLRPRRSHLHHLPLHPARGVQARQRRLRDGRACRDGRREGNRIPGLVPDSARFSRILTATPKPSCRTSITRRSSAKPATRPTCLRD